MPTPTDAVYRLTGVVVHHGTSPLSGHYTFIKEDFGIPIQIDDDTFRISNGKHMLTDSYLLQYERIPEDKDICHRYLPDILISVLECEGWAELQTGIQLAAGLSVRKHKLLELMQQLQISDKSLNHSWKTYKLLQEAIGHIGLFTGNTGCENLTKSILNYFCSHCPSILERSFGFSLIKHCHCTLCDTEDTYHEHELVSDIIKPVNCFVKSKAKSECKRCRKQSVIVEESVISCGKTIIVKNCIDILQQDTFKQTMFLYKPRALISSSSTIIFKYDDKNIYPLLLESFDEIAKLRMDQVLATIEMATDNCLLLLDKNTANEPCEQIYTLVKPLPVARTESEPLSILLTKEEETLTTPFKAPICVRRTVKITEKGCK
jgi:hypothetical protein